MGENAETYITFSVSIKKQITKIDKDGNDKIVDISYKMKFIDSFRFMSCHYQILLMIYLIDFIVIIAQTVNRDYMSVKDGQLIFRCFECEKNYKKDFNNELIKKFENIYEFCNEDINNFISLLRKGVYPYEYMDSWERFDETSLPDKEAFYDRLNMENITYVNYRPNVLNKCIEIYELDPAPGLAWLETEVEL